MDGLPGTPSRDGLVRSAIDRFERPLLLYAARVSGDVDHARDAVQETFAKLCSDPPADVNGHLAEWLYTVCRNRCIDRRRKEKRVTIMTETQAATFVGRDADPAATIERRDSTSHLLKHLARLPANQQEVIRLKFQHGMSYRQIVGITGLSEGNVGYLIHAGIKTLRERMGAAEKETSNQRRDA